MKRNLFLISFAAALVFAVSNLFVSTNASAQKTVTSGKAGSPKPSPTPTPRDGKPVLMPTLSTPAPTPPTLKEDDDIIKVDTELVNLDVRVIDRNNRTVNNLLEKDFKVLEDGNVQQIDFFSKSEVPTNYALVIDNSLSLRQQLEKVIEAGKVLVKTNRPADDTMVIRFVSKEKIEIVESFTSNKEDLEYALDNLYCEGGETALFDAIYLSVSNVSEYESEKKADERKRRAIVLVTDGENRNSFYTEKKLFELLRESEVQIYIIGFIDELSKESGFIGKSPQAKSKAFLERLANESGGKVYFPASAAELPALAKEISNELRTQYSIGYIPSNDKKDGTYRNIKVMVADGPKAEKRIAITRAGRTADAPKQQPTPAPSPTPATK